MTTIQTDHGITATTHFINGSWSPTGGRTFADRNPFNDDLVAEIAAGGAAEASLDRARKRVNPAASVIVPAYLSTTAPVCGFTTP